MKFFWKIFFTTMFISITCLVLGGYILINSNFNALLDNEVQTAFDYGDIVYYSLGNEFKDLPLSTGNEETETIQKIVAKVAQSININNMNQRIAFGILDADGNVVFSSLDKNFDKDIIFSLKENQVGWSLKRTESDVYVQTIRPAVFLENTFYVETTRAVSFIFDNQKSQYETLLEIMVGILILGGLITLTVSKLLMRRVESLTKVTKDISAGNLSKRSDMTGDDEFAVLSHNFNKMADNLEEKINELKDNAEKKELFVAAFSHELKTPLTSVIGYSDMLRRKKMEEEQIHACAEHIFSEGKRLETLSMRLLDLLVLRNREIHFVSVNMEDLFDEINSIISPQLIKSGIKYSYSIEYAVILLEPELMKTALINLIDNARKAISIDGEISINGLWHLDTYIITIKDTGRGMEKPELSKIMEAFYMTDKSRFRNQGGAGLGLAICDEILKLHGFKITFDSTVNVGTTVTITIKGDKNE